MASHGGAGVVNTVLRVGIPHVIIPLLGDQLFWAKLLERTKLSATVAATKERITAAILRASDPAVVQMAAEVGEKVRFEIGYGRRRFRPSATRNIDRPAVLQFVFLTGMTNRIRSAENAVEDYQVCAELQKKRSSSLDRNL